jgi:hypothetical protein
MIKVGPLQSSEIITGCFRSPLMRPRFGSTLNSTPSRAWQFWLMLSGSGFSGERALKQSVQGALLWKAGYWKKEA